MISLLKTFVYLQKPGIGPNREVELRCIGDEENVAVNVDRRPYRPEEQGEDVTRFMGRDKDWCAKIMHLENTQDNKSLAYSSSRSTGLKNTGEKHQNTWKIKPVFHIQKARNN